MKKSSSGPKVRVALLANAPFGRLDESFAEHHRAGHFGFALRAPEANRFHEADCED
jgi:hypothetical protein